MAVKKPPIDEEQLAYIVEGISIGVAKAFDIGLAQHELREEQTFVLRTTEIVERLIQAHNTDLDHIWTKHQRENEQKRSNMYRGIISGIAILIAIEAWDAIKDVVIDTKVVIKTVDEP